MKQTIGHTGNQNATKLALPGTLTKGFYTIQLQDGKTKMEVKFLKGK